MADPVRKLTGALRVLIVGAGLMGALHARAVRRSRVGVVAAVVDVKGEVSNRLAAELEVPGFADLERAIAEVTPDVAIIATPDSSHRAPAEVAISAGLAVLIEKPLASTSSDAQAITDAAQADGVRVMPGHILRFDSRYVDAADLLASGRLGRPILVTTAAWNRTELGDRVGDTTSPLWHLGIHHIDLMQWLTRQQIHQVSGALRVDSPTGASVFTGSGLMSGGTAFQLSTGWTLPAGHLSRHSAGMEVHCEEGVLTIAWAKGGLTISDRSAARRVEDRLWPSLYGEIGGILRTEVDHFLGAIIDGTPFAVTADEAVSAVRSAELLESESTVRVLS